MSARILVSSVAILVAAVFAGASPPDRPKAQKTENSVEALFDGIPQDLCAKVRDNPVRCDRVNDWLQENVNGKGKMFDTRVDLQEVIPYRRENGYLMHLVLKETKVRLLDADWVLHLGDHKLPASGKSFGSSALSYHFSFEGVSAAHAEATCDMKSVAVKGRVKEAKISRLHTAATPTLSIVLEDVTIENNRWAPYKAPTGLRGGADGGDNPFGGFGKGKSDGTTKKGAKKGDSSP